IGLETSIGLATRGCKVIIACRSNAEQVKADIIRTTNNPNIVTKHVNLASFTSVRNFCTEIHKTEREIDILIHNADLLKKSGNARIVFVSSILSFYNDLTVNNLDAIVRIPVSFWHSIYTYANSKVGQIIISNELAEKLRPFGITSNALHPGLVRTTMYDGIFAYNLVPSLLMRLFFLISRPFFMKKGLKELSSWHRQTTKLQAHFLWNFNKVPACVKNKRFRKKVWKKIEELVRLTPEEKIRGLP
ncbi:hypothetical protein NQ314_004785, partial [Rhamnusium bicolor]